MSQGGFLWAIGTTFLLLWLGICQRHLICLRRTAHAVTSGPAFEALTYLTPCPPRLLSHPAVLSPFLAGIGHPAIFLPAAYETEFDAAALRAILAHELAHLARRDNAWTLACRLLCALLWPQPLLWLLCRRLEQIGEEACDEAVLARDCSPRAYADCLLTLAECHPLGRRERALGAGVVPFRSSLGRRIAHILACKVVGLPAVPLHTRLSVAACGFTGPLVLMVLLGIQAEVAHFDWAKKQGWAIQPVQVIHIDHPGLVRVARLPYGITKQDQQLLNQLGFSGNGVRAFAGTASEKKQIETVLAAHPHFFYAEYLLGAWYAHHGDRSHASLLLARSLQDAPVILAGRYEYDDGTPLVGLEFSTSISCYDPKKLRAENSAFQHLATTLSYPTVITDADGCYYLPVFRALYSQVGVMWWSHDLNTLTASRLKVHTELITPGPVTSGRTLKDSISFLDTAFVANSRVGVLPPTKVRPQVQLNAPFAGADTSLKKPLLLSQNQLAISWKPYPNAVRYRITVFEFHIHGDFTESSGIASESNSTTPLNTPTTQTSLVLNFAGGDPVFNKTYPYSLSIEALDGNGETLSQSEGYYFKPVKATAPQTLTKAALAQALGPGFTVTSIQSQKDKVIVNAVRSAGLPWTPTMDNALAYSGKRFGLGMAGWSSKPGLSLDVDNGAQSIQITYSRNGY